MSETAQLDTVTLECLKDFGLRPGMGMDEIRQAMHDNRHHSFWGDAAKIEGCDGGAHLEINGKKYSPGELKKLLDAQALPCAAQQLRPLAQIEASIALHKENVVRGFLGIGQDLLDAKAQLNKHGAWMAWLERMGINQSTANKYMRLAGEVQPGTYLSTLPYSKALALIALPAGEREQFAEENSVQDKSAAEIRRLIAERDAAQKRADTMAANFRAQRDRADALEEQLQERPALIQQVAEVPDDYQALKMAAAHHQAEMDEAAQAAEEAEARAAAAEAELARVKREAGAQAGDKYTAAMGAANTFLMAVQLLPYDREELRGLYNRQRYGGLVKSVRDWCDEMADALEGGALDGEGAVV